MPRICQLLTSGVNRLLAPGEQWQVGNKVGARQNRYTAGMTLASLDPPAGLRQRKKQRTKKVLVDAAFTLFRRKGFDATTIDEIAEAVELSPRTFFRYFDSKEDVALTLQDQQFSALYAAFAARPTDEPVLTALRHATVAVMRACEDGTGGFDANQFSCVQKMIRDSPAVHARSLELCTTRLNEL